MGPHYSVEVEIRSSNAAIVTLIGEQDLSSKPEVANALTLAGQSRNVVVDLSACTFIDSSAITALLRASNALHRHGGVLELVIPADTHRAIRNVFELMGLQRVLPIHETTAEAIEHLDAPRPATTRTGMRLHALSEIIDVTQADLESHREVA